MEEEFKGTVIIYTISDCKQCCVARRELTSLNIPYTDICLDIFPQCRKEMEGLAGTSEVPQIFFNEVYIGGLEGLHKLANDEARLDALMEMLRTKESPMGAPSLPEPEVSGNNTEDRSDNEEDNDENGPPHNMEEIPQPNAEYTALISHMRKANLIRDNMVGTKKLCRNSFKGEDFIKWIMSEKKLKRSEAIDLGQKLVHQQGKLRRMQNSNANFDPDRFYEVSDSEEMKALNQTSPIPEPICPEVMNQLLLRLLTPLYERILSNNNKTVDYACLQDNEHFQRYLAYCGDLQSVTITEDTPRDLKIALFLNIYNIMQIHVIYKYGPPSNIWQRRKLTWSTYYLIDKKLYSLQSILNGIVRGNRKSDGMLWKPFGKKDHRRELIVKDPDPKVLFAASSGCRSTNPIRLYTAENLEAELKEVVQDALASDEYLVIDKKKKALVISPMFDWYATDFGLTHEQTIRWILENMREGVKKEGLKRLYDSKMYSVDYLDYDWSSNSKK